MQFINRPVAILWVLCITAFLSACGEPSERALRHHENGLRLIETGETEKAILEFRNALRLDETFVAARFELAKLLEQAGDLNGALANLRAVIESDPAHVDARIRLTNAMLMANEPERAMEHAQIAVTAAPELPAALVARSMAAYRLGDQRLALRDAKQALSLEPGNPDAGLVLAIERYDAGEHADAHAVLDQFIEYQPKALLLHLTKLRFLSEEDDDQAVGSQLARMTALFPEDPEIKRSLIDWHIGAGQFAQAIRRLRELQPLLPGALEPVLKRVTLIARHVGVAAARAELAREVEVAETPDPLRLELALFDLKAGARDPAVALLETLIADTDAPAVRASALLALARLQGSEGDFLAVEATTTKVLSEDPGNADALALRAAAQLRRDAIEDALVDIEAALTERPDDPDLLVLAGEIYQRNGSPLLAAESLSSAAEESGYDWETVRTFAAFLIRTGDTARYQTLIEETHRRHGEHPEIKKALINVRLGAGEFSEAKHLTEALRPLDPEAARRIEARIAMREQRSVEALASLEDLGSGADKAAFLVAKVRGYLQAGEQASARAAIDAGLTSAPNDETTLHLDAAWYEFARQPEQAEGRYRRILSKLPDNVSSYIALAGFLDRNGRADDAQAILDDGLKLRADTSALRMMRAAIAMRKGDSDSALIEFERVYAEHPDSVIAANNLASALADRPDATKSDIERAEKIARRLAGSRNPAFKDTYGWTRVRSGDVKRGLPYLIDAAAALPQNPWVQYHAGMGLLQAGGLIEAKRHLAAALSLSAGIHFPPKNEIRQAISKVPQ